MDRDAPVIEALTGVAAAHPSRSFWQCSGRLRLVGHGWSAKRVEHVCRALWLNRPRRAERRGPKRPPQPLLAPAALNGTWAVACMSDALYDSRRFRTLNVLDEGNREALVVEVATSLPGGAPRERARAARGDPRRPVGGARRQPAGARLRGAVRPGRAARRRPAAHPAREAESERLHRALQPRVPARGLRGLPLRLARRRGRRDRGVADDLRHRAAARQPGRRPAADLPAPAHRHPDQSSSQLSA